MVSLIRLLLLAAACPALACTYPDQGNMPLRRAITQVKLLPETQAWTKAMHESGTVVQYALLLDEPKREKGRCYWPVEVRAAGTVWRRFWVSPDGRSVLRPAASTPQPATAPAASTEAAR